MAELLIYDEIGEDFWGDGITAKKVAEAIKDFTADEEIVVRINSLGGQVYEAMGIYSSLKDHPANVKVIIDGVALSAASYIAMAGDEIEAPENSLFMIHNPRGYASGESKDLKRTARLMDKLKKSMVAVYSQKSGMSEDDVIEAMDEETWYDGKEALKAGFVTNTTKAVKIAAKLDLKNYENVPESVRNLVKAANKPPEKKKETKKMTEPIQKNEPVAATLPELKASCVNADSDFLMEQLEASATVAQAQSAWMKKQAESIEALAKEKETLAKEVDTLKASTGEDLSGVQAVGTGLDPNSTDADPVADYNEKLSGYEKKYNGNRMKALSALNRNDPEIRAAYVEACNAK